MTSRTAPGWPAIDAARRAADARGDVTCDPATRRRPVGRHGEINGRADLLVTFNRRHFETASAPFGFDVESPAVAVRRLRGPL